MGTCKYYIVQVDWEYLADNQSSYTLKKTKAARVRREDRQVMLDALKVAGVEGELIPTSYKPVSASFLEPRTWVQYACRLR